MSFKKEHLSLLKLLSKTKQPKYIVHELDTDILNCLSECCLNILHGNIPLSFQQKQKLKKHANKVRELTNKKISNKKRKAILQTGGFLPALLAPILGAVAKPLLQGLIG